MEYIAPTRETKLRIPVSGYTLPECDKKGTAQVSQFDELNEPFIQCLFIIL